MPGVAGVILLRLIVDAVAPNPHRDGAIQENCSSPILPFSGNTAPLSTTSSSTTTTRNGIVLSELLTTAEISRPITIEATARTATASVSSISGNLDRNAPC